MEKWLRERSWYRGFNDSINNLNSEFSTTEISDRLPAMNEIKASVIFWFGSCIVYL